MRLNPTKRTVLLAIVCLLMLMCSCSSSGSQFDGSGQNPAPQSTGMDQVLADINAYEPPSGVTNFEQLRQGLIDALEARNTDKIVMAAPKGSHNAVTDLVIDNINGTLTWTYVNTGDYDENGEVNVADLTQIAIHYGKTPASTDWIEAQVADGDRNEEINLADIQPIALNFLNNVVSCNIYGSADIADYPSDPDDPNGAGAVISGSVDFSEADDPPGFKTFTAAIDTPLSMNYYWVRPSDGLGVGAASNSQQYTGEGPNSPPNADLQANPLNGELPLTVDFDASGSSDTDGTIVLYEWDWDGAVGGFNWEETGNVAAAQHIYDTEGTYDPVVRVTDDLGATDTATVQIIVTQPVIVGYSISGSVIDGRFINKTPIPGITIYLAEMPGGNDYTDSKVSDVNGDYVFENVPADAQYEVWCDDPAWTWPTPRPVPLGDGNVLTEDQVNINIASNGPAM